MTTVRHSGSNAGMPEGSHGVSEQEKLTTLFDERRVAQPQKPTPPSTSFPTVPYLGPVAPPPVEPPPGPALRDYAGRLLVLTVVLLLMVIAAVVAIQRL